MKIVERTTVHISDDIGRIAMLENRTYGTAANDNNTLPALTCYIYSNHLQSASLELDENAEIISYEEYHPYGTSSYQSKSNTINAVAKRYKYTGKERDEESGLYYHGARYYVPWLCRWCASDPINSEWYNIEKGNLKRNLEKDFLELCASPYEYCYDNPSGEQPPIKKASTPVSFPLFPIKKVETRDGAMWILGDKNANLAKAKESAADAPRRAEEKKTGIAEDCCKYSFF